MRSELIRVYKVVHTWTGILAGMALFIAFYAGAITVFKGTLTRWASPPTASAPTVPLEQVPALLTRTFEAHPEATRSLLVHLVPEPPKDRVEWQTHVEGADEHDALEVRHFRATLDVDGNARTDEVHRSHLAEFIDVLHRVVGLPADNDAFRGFMGIVAVLYAVALFSGVVVLVPSLVKDLFALRIGPNLKRMWLDAHNVVGILSLPFHVVMATTAVVFAFHDGIYFAQDRLVHDGKLAATFQGARPESPEPPRDPATMLPPSSIVARVLEVAPSFHPSTLEYVRVTSPRAMVRVWGHDPKELSFRYAGGMAMVDPYAGRLISTDYLPGRQGAASLVLSSAFALHFATFGGAPVKWMYFCLALLGAWLFYGGNLLWVETRRRKASRRTEGAIPAQRRDVWLMASATVGVCLGAVCGISTTIVAAKWLHGRVADLNAWHVYTYYAVFFGSIAWALLRGPARGAIALLRLAVGTTLAIPTTTLLAALAPSLGMWAHRSTLGVDATAFVVAMGLLTMERATARRASGGPKDSVWSLHAHVEAGEGPTTAPDTLSDAEPNG